MLTENADCKKRPLVKFFQYTGIFSVSRGPPTNDITSCCKLFQDQDFEKGEGPGLALNQAKDRENEVFR